jgi:hypothetical protein
MYPSRTRGLALPLRSSRELLSMLDGLASIEEPKQLAIGE